MSRGLGDVYKRQTGDFFFNKRVQNPPPWLQTATVHFPSGRSATELVPVDAAHLVWATQQNNIDWNPWPSASTAAGSARAC